MILSNGIETDFHNMLSCPSMPIVKVENQRHVVVVMMLYYGAAVLLDLRTHVRR